MTSAHHRAGDQDATQVHHVPGYWPPRPNTPAPQVMTIDCDCDRSMLERLLEVGMRVVVIITCVIVVIAILDVYTALGNLRDSLQGSMIG